MYYGIPTLLELENIEECAKVCSGLCLHFVEINMNLPCYQPDKIDPDKLNKIAEEYGIYYTFHLDEKFDISDFNPLISNAYTETFMKTVRIAKKIKARIINMHLNEGVYFTLPSERVYLYKKYEDEYLKSISSFVSLAENEIGDSGIKITIENTGGFTPFQKKAMDIMLESKAFGLCYDLGHDYKHGKPDESFVLENREKLCHMHFHDATKNSDHLPLGEGENDLTKYLYLANEVNASVVLETKTAEGLKKSVKWLENTPMPIML